MSKGVQSRMTAMPKDGHQASPVVMTPDTTETAGQFWRWVDLGNGKRALRPWVGAGKYSLGVSDTDPDEVALRLTDSTSREQIWSLQPHTTPSGFLLINDASGKALDLDKKNDLVLKAVGDRNTQVWNLTPSGEFSGIGPVPALYATPNAYEGEGPTDFTTFLRPTSTVKAVMIFIDFPNAPSSAGASEEAGKWLGTDKGINPNIVVNIFKTQSHGALDLEVDDRSDLGWKRMPQNTDHYHVGIDSWQAHYLEAAAALFVSAVNFSTYQIVLVVTPFGTFENSEAWSDTEIPIKTRSGEIQFALFLNNGKDKRRYGTLAHELGHIFGLPDLYSYYGGGWPLGCWDLMSDDGNSVSFLGWHRHKNGWLKPSQSTLILKQYGPLPKDLQLPPMYVALSPFSNPDGLSMVVGLVGIISSLPPIVAFVLELAQPVFDAANNSWGQGVLLYTVDSSVASGNCPVILIPKNTDSSPQFGELYKAPFLPGDTFATEIVNVSLSMTVFPESTPECYYVRVQCQVNSLFGTTESGRGAPATSSPPTKRSAHCGRPR